MLIYLSARYSKIIHRGFDNFQTCTTPNLDILENRPAESDRGAYLPIACFLEFRYLNIYIIYNNI